MQRLDMVPIMKNSSSTANPPDPTNDRITHINVHYNAAKDKLGRMLSTYYVAKFNHPYFGPFKCIEGFMLFVRTGCRDDAFRRFTGSEAKTYYRQQIKLQQLKTYDVPNEQNVLMFAYAAMLKQHPVIAAEFIASVLPFDNYFLYGVGKVPIRPEDSEMLTASLSQLREYMKADCVPEDTIDYAALRQR